MCVNAQASFSGPSGLPVSLSFSQTHSKNHQLNKAVGLGLPDPGGHLDLVPGGLQMLDASQTLPRKEEG